MKRMNSAAAQAMPKKSHHHANVAMPDYWQHLGLKKDPLGKSLGDDASYTPQKWEEYLDTLQNFYHSKNVLLAIIGVTGSGKSTLLKQFITQLGNNAQIHQVEGQSDFDQSMLVETLASGFKLSIPDEESAEEQLDAQLVEIQQSKKTCLLVIDNAHLLPSETLQAICDLIAQQSSNQMRLHVLLAGEISLQARFDVLDVPADQVHVISLEGFTLEETDQYLQHRLATAGHNGEILFSQAAVMRIYRLSSGIPGRINRLAQRMLQNALAAPAEVPPLLSGKQVKLLGAGLLIALLAVVALGLTYLNSRHQHAGSRVKNILPLPNQVTEPHALALPPSKAEMAASPNKPTPAQTISVRQAEALMLKGTGAETVVEKSTPAAKEEPSSSTTDGNAFATTLMAEDLKNNAREAANQALAEPVAQTAKEVAPSQPAPAKVTTAPAQQAVASAPTPQPVASAPQTSAVVTNKEAMAETAPVLSDDEEINVTANDLPAASKANPAPVDVAVVSPVAKPKPEAVAVNTQVKQTVVKPPRQTAIEAPKVAVAPEPNAETAKVVTLADAKETNSTANSTDESTSGPVQAKGFSLQIMGSHQESALNRLVAKAGLGDKAKVFHTHFQGQDWYVLTYGQYTSSREAQAAVASLPKAIRDLKPWPRKVADLQK